MACKRKVPSREIQQAGGVDLPSIRIENLLADLANFPIPEPALLDGRFVMCRLDPPSNFLDSGEVKLLLHAVIDGVMQREYTRLTLTELRGLAEASRTVLRQAELARPRDNQAVGALRSHPKFELQREDLDWLIGLLESQADVLQNHSWFPVTACRQILWSLLSGCETPDGRSWTRLQVIEGRRLISNISISLEDIRQILAQGSTEQVQVSSLDEGGWVAVSQAGGNAVFRYEELRLLLARYQELLAGETFPDELRERLIAWQNRHRRMPSRKLARNIAEQAAEDAFHGSAFARHLFSSAAENHALWLELLERQDRFEE